MPAGWTGLAIGAAGAIGSAVIGSSAASSAANAQVQAANTASATEMQMFDQTQQNLQPYMASGGNALSALMSQLGLSGAGATGTPAAGSPLAMPTYNMPTYGAAQYQSSPGYQFQLQQGLGAVNNAATLGSGVNSGNTLKALQTYGQGVANQDYQQGYQNYSQNYLNQYNAQTNNAQTNFSRLQTLAGSGQNAAAGLGALGSQVAGQVGSNTLGAGNAQAAGSIAQGQTLSNLLSTLTASGGSSTPSYLQQIYAGLYSGGSGTTGVGNGTTLNNGYNTGYGGG